MAVKYYDMRHEGAQIDDAVGLVLSGDILVATCIMQKWGSKKAIFWKYEQY